MDAIIPIVTSPVGNDGCPFLKDQLQFLLGENFVIFRFIHNREKLT